MKSVLKIFGSLILAEFLTLFINLTLSFSGHLLLRLICTVCTCSILAGLCGQAGYSIAETHRKQHLSLKKLQISGLGFISSLPFLICWILLFCARQNLIHPEFYRSYKLLCAPFLNLCNMFSTDVSALTLPVSGLLTLLLVSFLPMAAFCTAYYMTSHGKLAEQIMYRS
ncbi:MAG: hypothetical protein IJ644_11555 [Oscillospiraceae bacterium]|nr:hypothetical protein [Oscillospiraceae bacterium]